MFFPLKNAGIMLATYNIRALTNIWAALNLSGMPWPTDLSLMLSIELNFYWRCCRNQKWCTVVSWIFWKCPSQKFPLGFSIIDIWLFVSPSCVSVSNIMFLHPYLCPLSLFLLSCSPDPAACVCAAPAGGFQSLPL